MGDRDARKELISPSERLSVNRPLQVLGISKGKYYYEPKGPSQQEIDICHKIDEHHDVHPAKGVRQMRLFLLGLGLVIGVKKVRRLMRDMGIETVYAKLNLSRLGRTKYYLGGRATAA